MKRITAPVKRTCSCVAFLMRTAWRVDRGYFACLLLSALLGAGASLNLLLFPKYILDSLYPVLRLREAFVYAGIMIVTALAISLLQGLLSERIERCNRTFDRYLNRQLYEKLLSLRFVRLEDSAILDDLETAKKGIAETGIPQTAGLLLQLITNFLTLFSVLGIISRLSPLVLLLALAVSLVNAAATLIVNQRQYRYDMTNRVESRKIYTILHHAAFPEYGKETRLFHLEPFCSRNYSRSLQWIDRHNTDIALLNMKTSFFTALAYGGQIFLVYWYLSRQLLGGQATVGDFSLYISAILQFSSLFSAGLTGLSSLLTQSLYMEALKRFLEQEDGFSGCDPLPERSPLTIEFDHVSFHYPGQERETLSDLCLTIRENESLSIVGPNGAGKTTFVKLLMGLYPPTGGVIRINGKDRETCAPGEYARLFSTVFQDFHILSYTLGENVAMSETVEEEPLARALEQAGLTERAARLPRGAATPMTRFFDEEGLELSGGEQQKLAISRAFYKDAPVFILDEPTAALSPRSEDELYRRVNRLAGQKTILFISHRLSSCRIADRIVVFAEGRLAQEGSHDALMAEPGLYADMFNTQAQNYQEGGEEDGTAEAAEGYSA
ncbi:MAG: ABC transporter ATP-binding protein [Clostridiales bacterium]|nr:ABC transporter ATP-binding protein [Clostridiales bacterium]